MSKWSITFKKPKSFESYRSGVPEVSFEFTSVVVEARTRRIRTRWSPELAQDLMAYQVFNAEAELTDILSAAIAAEIDREVVENLRNLQTNLWWNPKDGYPCFKKPKKFNV